MRQLTEYSLFIIMAYNLLQLFRVEVGSRENIVLAEISNKKRWLSIPEDT